MSMAVVSDRYTNEQADLICEVAKHAYLRAKQLPGAESQFAMGLRARRAGIRLEHYQEALMAGKKRAWAESD